MNRIRSSRGLEKECKRNIELMWLLKGLVPDHNTISNFRKDNPKAIKKVFRSTVQLAKNMNLIGGILIAGDGTKLRAQNSKKNNRTANRYNERKVAKHLEYIKNKLTEYNNKLSTADGDKKKEIQEKINKHKKHQTRYQNISKHFDHIITKKTMKHASTDMGFIFIAYNLKRILNILGITALMELFVCFLMYIFALSPIFNQKALLKLQINGFSTFDHKS